MIDDNDMERLRDVFVTRQEYIKNNAELYKNISGYDTRLAVIETKLKTISWLLTTAVGGIIVTLIKLFVGG